MKTASRELHGTLLFHLNLNYSSIEVEEQPTVVERCYRPMLGLLERLPWLVMAVEASGHTLERLESLDREWVESLAEHVRSGRVEFVGSGDTQLIGPLVPAEVNRWNQRLGLETYERLLGSRPATALVNEMAWSQGIVDAYVEAGYELLLMEWSNPRRAHPEWENEWRYRLARTRSPAGRTVELAWIDAIAFQKFQRAAVGELDLGEYRRWIAAQASEKRRHVFVYANDAEIFDHRPGRFRTEPALEGEPGSEWRRIAELVQALRDDGLVFTTPGRLRRTQGLEPVATVTLNSAADPIPVKKQAKYNVTRWALSGRDDVGLNSRCHAQAARLAERGAPAEEWRALCRLWASDLRTHITEKRWQAVQSRLPDRRSLPHPGPGPSLRRAEFTQDARTVAVETDGVRLRLLRRKGLAIESLRFVDVDAGSLVSTLPFGYFDHIDWAADYYSGHSTILRPGEPLVTDLEPVDPLIERCDDRVEVRARVRTSLGEFEKVCRVYGDRIELLYGFAALGKRPKCSLRTGTITLDPEAFGPGLRVTCCHGGAPEDFDVQECDHVRSVSALVSAGAAFGATTGELSISDGTKAIDLSWPMAAAAALPMFTSKQVEGRRFRRCVFSLAELDETYRDGASLPDFCLAVRARRIA